MNEIKYAAEELRYTKRFYSSSKSFDLAIVALEKQIPKKPNRIVKSEIENGGFYGY